MCPANVHWHLGAEHLLDDEYDALGIGPSIDKYDEENEHAEDINAITMMPKIASLRNPQVETLCWYSCG